MNRLIERKGIAPHGMIRALVERREMGVRSTFVLNGQSADMLGLAEREIDKGNSALISAWMIKNDMYFRTCYLFPEGDTGIMIVTGAMTAEGLPQYDEEKEALFLFEDVESEAKQKEMVCASLTFLTTKEQRTRAHLSLMLAIHREEGDRERDIGASAGAGAGAEQSGTDSNVNYETVEARRPYRRQRTDRE